MKLKQKRLCPVLSWGWGAGNEAFLPVFLEKPGGFILINILLEHM